MCLTSKTLFPYKSRSEEAIPHINGLSRKYSGEGLVVVGQNLGEDEKKVAAFIRKMGSKMSDNDFLIKILNLWFK